MIKRYGYLLFFIFCFTTQAKAGDVNGLFDSLRQKILLIKDYTAEVKMKINVKYMRIPQLSGTLYFKSPDKMRFDRHGGLSILPKKNNNLILRNLIPPGHVTVIDAGDAMIGGKRVRIIKVIPEDEKSDIVLTKIWVDEAALLAVRTETTTKTDGTMVMDLEYGKYKSYGLPDHVTLIMDVKEYKMPKGVTMDYTESMDMPAIEDMKGKKGTIQISYLSYEINKGLDDNVFAKKE
jgi:hypothetical protein